MKRRTRKPTHPGAIIRRDCLEPLDLTVTALAAHLGVSRKRLSQVANEKAGVTPTMALRLSRAFNTTPELWLNLQRKRDLWEAEQQSPDWEKVAPLLELVTVNSDRNSW